ncbi:MAG: hypothetical protein ACU0DI_04285 [Paracoccaceae bacterium]
MAVSAAGPIQQKLILLYSGQKLQEIKERSQIGHAACHDVRRLLLDERIAEIRGEPTPVKVRGKIFWYDKYRAGTDIKCRPEVATQALRNVDGYA